MWYVVVFCAFFVFARADTRATYDVPPEVYDAFITKFERWRPSPDEPEEATVEPKWWAALGRCKGVVDVNAPRNVSVPDHKIAAVTVSVALHGPQIRTWRNYYGKQFGHENVFLAVSISGKVKNYQNGDPKEAYDSFRWSPELRAAYAAGANMIAVSCGKGYNMQVADLANDVAALLRSVGYQTIVYADDDEILVPSKDKYPGGLKEYVAKLLADPTRPPWARAHGYNVREADFEVSALLHVPFEKTLVDRTKPIFEQRAYWIRADPFYCKCLITATPWSYASGQHEGRPLDKTLVQTYGTQVAANCSHNADPDLALVHLKCMERWWLKDQTFREYAIEDRETKHRWVVNASLEAYNSTEFEDLFQRSAWHAKQTCGWSREGVLMLKPIPPRFKTNDL